MTVKPTARVRAARTCGSAHYNPAGCLRCDRIEEDMLAYGRAVFEATTKRAIEQFSCGPLHRKITIGEVAEDIRALTFEDVVGGGDAP